MSSNHKRDHNDPVPPGQPHAWIWLVATVVALSALANAIG